jgi:CDP-diacylglycerol--glycerol-3-phosphate 3-phosphatidyltransferase
MLYLGYFFNAKLAQSVGNRARNSIKATTPSFRTLQMPPVLSKVPWLAHLPNQLTLARILAIPFLLFIYPLGFYATNIICALVFAIAGITDILDGYFARRYNQESRVGALLDPIADKMLSGACLILLADANALPAWICGLMLCRDIAVSGMRMIALEDGFTIPVSSLGKIKTILQDVAIFCLMLGQDIFDIPFRLTGMVAIWLGLAVSLYSGYLYFEDFLETSAISGSKPK